eukprot:TRINITY_DN55933_c0_g1_i1.p1 TRINITY_DN55933_c0_g1~~TRINITY_DN55933_c0_g1_i1.p1  ORF type:complete len:198 (-),score=28.88 TRINITY_DN55933_c0_g1_i1:90-683(-)
MALFTPQDLTSLSQILDASAPTSREPNPLDDVADTPQPSAAFSTPAQIGAPPLSSKTGESQIKSADPDDIWTDSEVPSAQFQLDPTETRKRPEYELRYRQSLSSTDVFLGMDFEKDNTSMSCEAMVVDVKLPGERLQEISCDVQEQWLEVQAKRHRLQLPLPRRVRPNQVNAKWDADRCILSVTMGTNNDHLVTKYL